MAQRPRQLTPWVSLLREWGYQLRELRNSQGLSLRELSKRARIEHSHLGRFQRAERMPDRSQATVLDGVLGASGMLLRLEDLEDDVVAQARAEARQRLMMGDTSPVTVAVDVMGRPAAEQLYGPGLVHMLCS
ncbi:helix-turn-helix transcriptional regulator [Streptomyces sp. MNP-20]|uniref:helix-turn-helix domain-containing protein n=1 Tax=Streptomyces sp. MNP-20 TaxID=2721165 RepID=UPI001551C905|nr:helix-turn-helix transcriptional regulator [Streptomyces sp. MNP-20]